MLDDSSDVRIVNNTVANNVSTASSETSDGRPHSAGLASEANSPQFQAIVGTGPGVPRFANPTALFNNIFWNNNAFTLSQPGPGATLVNQGFIDFEIHGTTNPADTYTPRYSSLTNGLILGPDGVQRPLPAGQGNRIGEDPLFLTPFVPLLIVTGSRLDPQTAAVTITGSDPPVGLTGNYHLPATSPAVDQGVRCSNTPVPANLLPCLGSIPAPSGDYDGQNRPQLNSSRTNTPWDLGADELPGTPVLLVTPLRVLQE
jgi:hypothetical protein